MDYPNVILNTDRQG